jgi:hypothetical protein
MTDQDRPSETSEYPWPYGIRFTYDQGEMLINYDDATRAYEALKKERDELRATLNFSRQDAALAFALRERDALAAQLAELQAQAEMLTEVLKSHYCLLGSKYFDGEDRVVTECSACQALSRFTAWKEGKK